MLTKEQYDKFISLAAVPDETLTKSLWHCHVPGVHSIILREAPLIRIFIAEANTHSLWRNQISETLSVGLHPHHCDLTVTCLDGVLTNVTPDGILHLAPTATPGFFAEYLWDSPIVKGFSSARFYPTGKRFNFLLSNQVLASGDSILLPADQLHTVQVARGKTAAWLVEEGSEAKSYLPTCYTNADLTDWSSSGLYTPMTPHEARGFLTVLFARVKKNQQQTVTGGSGV